MAMPDTSTYTFVLGATGEETLPGTITTGFTLAEDESWYKITYGTMSKTKGPYWYNPSKSDTLTYWTLKMVDVDDPTVMLDDGWLNGGPDLAPQAKSARGSGETVQLPDLRQIASEQFRGKTIGLMPYNIALYGKLSVTITTFHHTYSVTYGTPTGGTVGAKINSGSAYYTTGAKRGDTQTLYNTPASGYLFRRYVITDSSGTIYQTANTYTMKYSDVTITAEFTPENEPPTFSASAMPVKINQAVSAGALIKGLSGIRASITNAAAADPKTIAGYRINIPGYGSTTSQTYTTGALTSSGTVTIEYTVTDSNGNSTTKWISVNVLNYNEPGASISFARCGDAQMSDDPLGIYVKYKVTPYYTDVDSNYIQSVTLLISGTSTAKTLVADGNWHVIDNYTIIPENSVTTTLTVTDKFTSVSSTEIIPSANYAIYMSSDGTSIGFGKATTHQNSFEIAPSRTVYVGWNTAQNEQYTLDDYIALKAGNTINEAYVVAQFNSLTAQQKQSVITALALKDGAFADIANNLTTAVAGSVLDARQGKALYDAIKKVDLTNAVSYTVDSSSVGAIQANSLKCYRYGNMVHLEFVLTFSSSQSANCIAWRADMTGLPQPICAKRGDCCNATYSSFNYSLSEATNDVNTLRIRFVYNGSSASSGNEYPIVIEYLTEDV